MGDANLSADLEDLVQGGETLSVVLVGEQNQ